MSNDRAVVNASPLITLCKSGLEDLLPKLFREIVVPGAVWSEVLAGGAADLAAMKLETLQWLHRDDSTPIAPIIQAWDLGAGESAVLSYALAQPQHVAIIDDAAARRCARSLNLPVAGTIGLIVLAKRRRLIPQVTAAFQTLRDAGLWISEELIQKIKTQEGE